MITVSDSIEIDATPTAVFEYLDDPQHHYEITPSLSRVENVEGLDNGGKRLDHTYTLGGIDLDGSLVQTVHEPPTRMVFEMTGRLQGELELEIVEENGGTRVTYSAGYDLPGTVIERLAEPFVRRYNEREIKTVLTNLKSRLES